MTPQVLPSSVRRERRLLLPLVVVLLDILSVATTRGIFLATKVDCFSSDSLPSRESRILQRQRQRQRHQLWSAVATGTPFVFDRSSPVRTTRPDPSGAAAAPVATTTEKNRKSKKKRDREYQWLNWLYHQWKQRPVGMLDESILSQFVPAMTSYAKRRSTQAADRARQLLDRNILEYQAGNPHAKLNVTIFNAAMNCYAAIGKPEPAEEILGLMNKLAKENPGLEEVLKPDVICLTTLASAWSRSRTDQAPRKTLAYLEYMESHNMSPSTHTYNTVLASMVSGTSKSDLRGSEKAQLSAMSLIRRMKERYAQGREECKPSVYTYQLLITNMRGNPLKAEQVLNYLKQQADESGDKSLEPNAHVYSAAINAFAYSHHPDKAKKAYELLQDMKDRYEKEGKVACRPNVVVYTAVLNACCKPSRGCNRDLTFSVARLVLEELQYSDYGDPNFLTYASFLRVCAECLRSNDDDKDAVVRPVFEQCCQAGQVGPIVLEKLKDAASPSLYEELLRGRTWEEIPQSWTRSVKTSPQSFR